MRSVVGFLAFMLSAGAYAGELRGTWSRPCEATAEGSSSAAIEFVDEYSQEITTYFEDANCTKRSYSYTAPTSYKVKDPTGSDPRIKPLDQTLAWLKLTLYSAELVERANATQYCGISKWAVDLPIYVCGLNCGGIPMPDPGTKTYTIYKINGGNLNFGAVTEAEDGLSPETRPTQLNTVRTYVKVRA